MSDRSDHRASAGSGGYWVPGPPIDDGVQAADGPPAPIEAQAQAPAPWLQPASAHAMVPGTPAAYVADPRFGLPGDGSTGDQRLGEPTGDPRFARYDPGAPSPSPRQPERERRGLLRWGWVAFLVLVALAPGFQWVGRQLDRSWDLGTDYSHVVAVATDLPSPVVATREHPTPGFEETGAPLGVAPIVTSSSTSYAFIETRAGLSGEVPVTWSPCRPIHFVVDTTHAPEEFIEQVMAAVGAVSVASGLAFVYDGAVTEAPTAEREPYQPHRYGDRWAPVLIQFADATAVPDFAGDAVGLATTVRVRDTLGVERYVTGTVQLHTDLLRRSGRSGVPAYVPVLRHELGHVIGLDHVDDGGQLMFSMTNSVATYQAGDLAGLAILGQGRCAPSL